MRHCVIDCLTAQLIPWSCDDGGVLIEFADDFNVLMEHIMCTFLCSGKNDTCCSRNLIIKELLEVSVVCLASFRIYNCGIAAAFQTFYRSYDRKDVSQFSDTGWFNDDMVRCICFNNFSESFLEVALQCTAYASAIDFIDNDTSFFQESAVNTDFSKFIFYKDYLFACEHFSDQLLDQSCLTGTKESAYNIYFCHNIQTSLS